MHTAWGACSPRTHAHTDTNALRQLITRRLLFMTLGLLLPRWLAFYCCVSNFRHPVTLLKYLAPSRLLITFYWPIGIPIKTLNCSTAGDKCPLQLQLKNFHYFWSNILRIWHRWKILKLHFFVIPCISPFRQLCSIATLLLNKYIG